jgi:thiaminase/transcriptional activator TenA
VSVSRPSADKTAENTADASAHEPATFSQELWRQGASTYDEILRHPFLTGLTDGSLDSDAFRYFVIQDSHYLRVYARALSLVAARATDPDAVALFARHASGAIEVERELHASLLEGLGLSAGDVDDHGSGPTTTAYTSYLLGVCATGTYAEAVATVLPCYWVYREVGRELLTRSSPDPLYARWIATYGSPEFDAVVESVLAVTDRLGSDIGQAERHRCRQHFATTTRYEWMFWDAAYRQLAWPI